MSLGVKSTIFATTLILAGSAFAGNPNCPKLSDIKAEGISMSHEIKSNQYLGYSVSKYNTPILWAFAMGPVDVDDANKAIEMTNELLTKLTNEGTPDTIDGQFVCMYETGDPNLMALAVKAERMSPMQFKQFMHRAH